MKEDDIRPADLFDRYLQLVRQDISTFFSSTSNLVYVACPACGADQPSPAFAKWGFDYVTCSECNSLYLNPRPTDESLQEFYENGEAAHFWATEYYPQTIEKRRLPVYRSRASYLHQSSVEHDLELKSIVDVGCGFGIFLEELSSEFPQAKKTGIEPNPLLAKQARVTGSEILETWLGSKGGNIQIGQADCITLFEVLEHLFSPLVVLSDAYRMLDQSGLLFLTTLCSDGFDIQVLWEEHKNIYPPAHINILSREGFKRLLGRSGFRILEERTPGRLDVDIVRREGRHSLDKHGFFTNLIYGANSEILERFQAFLADNKMSSHYWLLAQKDESIS